MAIIGVVNEIALVDRANYLFEIKPKIEEINDLITHDQFDMVKSRLRHLFHHAKLLIINPVWVHNINYDTQDQEDFNRGYFGKNKKPTIVSSEMPLTPLMVACKEGNLNIAKMLLDIDGINVNTLTDKGEHILTFALKGNNNQLREVIAKHKDLDLYGTKDITTDIIKAQPIVPILLTKLILARKEVKIKDTDWILLEEKCKNSSANEAKYYSMLLGLFKAKERGIINWTKNSSKGPVPQA